MSDLDADALLSPRRAADRPATLVDELMACHQRIRSFTDLAARLGDAAALSPDDVRDAATRVRRYFAEALPLHVADEDDSILPRLRGRDAAVDLALRAMAAEHDLHAPLVARLVAICEALSDEPDRHSARAGELSLIARALDRAFAAHLRVEEHVIFPALEVLLGPDDRASIRAEMRARRG